MASKAISRLRHQLPAYSPVSLPAIGSAAFRAFGLFGDPRPGLSDYLRKRYDAEAVVLYGSGTEALVDALRIAASLAGRPAPIALPAFSCFNVASAAVAADVPIAFYDLDPSTLNPDWESLMGRLVEGARVVVTTPLYGIPVDHDRLAEAVGGFGAVVVEDAAQGFGAAWRGRPLGALGDLSVVSFGRGKGWTGGRGGALFLRGEAARAAEDADLNRSPRWELGALSVASAQWGFGRPALYTLPAAIPWLGLGETRYQDAPPPRGLTRSAAALLLETLESALAEGRARQSNAEGLLGGISFDSHVRRICSPPGGTPGFLRLPLRLRRGLLGFASERRASRVGIAASYPSTLPALDPVRPHVLQTGPYPGAEELVEQLVTLPTHSLLSAEEKREVLHLTNTYSG